MMTAIITVRDAETGKTAEHHIYNLAKPMGEADAREWVRRNECDPWVFEGLRHESA